MWLDICFFAWVSLAVSLTDADYRLLVDILYYLNRSRSRGMEGISRVNGVDNSRLYIISEVR